jgi:hypothetical protein
MEAVQKLGLENEPLCLMFGTVEPYKQIEEVIAHWRTARPKATLTIVGKPSNAAYAAHCRQLAAGLDNVSLRLEWLPDEQLRLWLSAANAAIFNYRTIFTSGAASLARSWGVPILIPRRLHTVDLAEPNARVHRFESFATDFGAALASALAIPARPRPGRISRAPRSRFTRKRSMLRTPPIIHSHVRHRRFRSSRAHRG